MIESNCLMKVKSELTKLTRGETSSATVYGSVTTRGKNEAVTEEGKEGGGGGCQ